MWFIFMHVGNGRMLGLGCAGPRLWQGYNCPSIIWMWPFYQQAGWFHRSTFHSTMTVRLWEGQKKKRKKTDKQTNNNFHLNGRWHIYLSIIHSPVLRLKGDNKVSKQRFSLSWGESISCCVGFPPVEDADVKLLWRWHQCWCSLVSWTGPGVSVLCFFSPFLRQGHSCAFAGVMSRGLWVAGRVDRPARPPRTWLLPSSEEERERESITEPTASRYATSSSPLFPCILFFFDGHSTAEKEKQTPWMEWK